MGGPATDRPSLVWRDDRGVLAVSGEDRVSFLQGLVSNDVTQAGPDRALYAAFLTPQGKFLHDFFVIADGERLLLEMPAAGCADLQQRLSRFRLRARVALADVGAEFMVAVLFGTGAAAAVGLPERAGCAGRFAGGPAVVDPRLADLGVRLLIPRTAGADALAGLAAAPADAAAWQRHRLVLGVPEAPGDLVPEKSILLETGFDELNGISWTKGCYLGQELTARTKYRGLVKKRLVPVRLAAGPLPPPGTLLSLPDGGEAGEMRSGCGDLGLALVRLEALAEAERTGDALIADGQARLVPVRPGWLRL